MQPNPDQLKQVLTQARAEVGKVIIGQADVIAKAQSALLQAMQEHTVTIDRETHQLPATFTVFATQNPIEYEGTYPLPEAQKDRFMLKISMSPPDRTEELNLAQRMLGAQSPEA